MKTNPTSANTGKSIAVLPFVNRSSDPDNEYFSDGITEEIINALTGIQGLKVIARTSSFAFKGKNIDVRDIGRQLAVTSILEGSVRKTGDRVRVTAQLVRTDDGAHFWSETFDRKLEDIFATQDELSLLIADQIRENFGHFDIQEQLFESHTNSVEAYKGYLKGRYHQLKWDIDNFKRAIEQYQEAIKTDPGYPMPYYGLVQCYTYLFMWQAISKREAIRETHTLLQQLRRANAHLAEYHLARSSCAILLHWDFQLAHAELKKTLSINPSNVDALEALAGLYIVIGEFEKGIKVIDKALEVNPLSANHSFMKGNIYYFAGAYEKTVEWMDIALNLDPDMQLAAQVKMAGLLLLGQHRAFEAFLKQYQPFTFASNFRTLHHLMLGEPVAEARLNGDFKNEFQPWPLYFAVLSGNLEQAFTVLKSGLEHQVGQYFCFRHDPFLQPLRADARYQEISLAYPAFSISEAVLHIAEDKSASTKLEEAEVEKYLNDLKRVMEEEEPYLNPMLTLKLLSDIIDLHPNKLSWLLNEHTGKNFNEYINTFRLHAFKANALDPANQHITLLGLAYESGFNSKTVFNAFFKKMEGLTPSAWVSRQRK